MGGGDVNVPGPSKEEKALQAEQTELLRQQREILADNQRQQELLAPILYEEYNILPEINAEGEIVGFTKQNDEMAQLSEDVQMKLLERTRTALAGELPVDPTIERELIDQEATLRETLRKQLGSGYETSTPGIEALQKFAEGKASLRSAAQTGQMTLAEQLGIARGGFNQNVRQQTLASALGINQGSLPFVQGSLGVNQGMQGIVNKMQMDRQMQLQASIANAQNQVNPLDIIFGGAGLAAGFL